MLIRILDISVFNGTKNAVHAEISVFVKDIYMINPFLLPNNIPFGDINHMQVVECPKFC